jgi:phosphohistidine phosphatase SixA
MICMRHLLLCLLFLPAVSMAAADTAAVGPATFDRPALLQALRTGGLVIAMRHTHSPNTLPDAAQAEAGNTQHERQLDATGRDTAAALGAALLRLRIPVGQVHSSPTFRALQTARLAKLPTPQTPAQLGDGGQSMQGDSSGSRGAWLRTLTAQAPQAGTNTWIITHFPNLTEAFPDDAKGLADGEALVLRPDGHGNATLLARVHIEDWGRLDAANPGR